MVKVQVGPPTKKERELNQDKLFELSRGFLYLVSRHSNIPKIMLTGSLLPVNRQLKPQKIPT